MRPPRAGPSPQGQSLNVAGAAGWQYDKSRMATLISYSLFMVSLIEFLLPSRGILRLVTGERADAGFLVILDSSPLGEYHRLTPSHFILHSRGVFLLGCEHAEFFGFVAHGLLLASITAMSCAAFFTTRFFAPLRGLTVNAFAPHLLSWMNQWSQPKPSPIRDSIEET